MKNILEKFDLIGNQSGVSTGDWLTCRGEMLNSISPIDNQLIGNIRTANREDYEDVIQKAETAFTEWQMVPAPKRGEIVRQMGLALREYKAELGALVTLEMGKIKAEGEGEVQEMIDICDFAVGQSRMLYGLTMHSERPGHRMYEQWHPLGPVGVITAFNFPVAVWAWNAMIALIAGNTVIWKPSSKTPLTAIATMKIMESVLKKNKVPAGVLNLVIGNREQVGESMINDRRLPLISATGSVPMGRHIGQTVAARLGKTILELGGNNGIVVTPEADLDLVTRAILFGAIGTAGQRCTTTRRIIVEDKRFDELSERLIAAYKQVPIGNPLDDNILMGPLVDREAVQTMQKALERFKTEGGFPLYGGEVLTGGIYESGTYVTPCICAAKPGIPIVSEETFAPILYLIAYKGLDQAIEIHNQVPQGLSSAIFTQNLTEAESFLSHQGSDCGIANVNIGTSGAEIGGAFGGEKETGGGRESGSDAWKAYMRRQTCTINWSGELPLAQGIKFDV